MLKLYLCVYFPDLNTPPTFTTLTILSISFTCFPSLPAPLNFCSLLISRVYIWWSHATKGLCWNIFWVFDLTPPLPNSLSGWSCSLYQLLLVYVKFIPSGLRSLPWEQEWTLAMQTCLLAMLRPRYSHNSLVSLLNYMVVISKIVLVWPHSAMDI